MKLPCQLPTMLVLVIVLILSSPASARSADPLEAADSLRITAHHHLNMTINTRQPLVLPVKAPRIFNQDPSILSVTAQSPQQLMMVARRAGTTQLFIWESANTVRSIKITVLGHGQILQNLLTQHFPELAVKVSDSRSGVTLSGNVPSEAVANQVGNLARQHVPLLINKLTISPAAVVILHTQVIEVSSSDARSAGIPSLRLTRQRQPAPSDHIQVAHADSTPLPTESIQVGVIGANNPFHATLAKMLETGVARVIAEPVLATVSGTTATYNSGGRYPVVLPQKNGQALLQYEPFGLELKITPMLTDQAAIQLRVRPEVTEVPKSASMQYEDVTIPAFRTRAADATMRLQAGQTLVLQGMPQGRTRTALTGLPVLKDIPLVGAAFQSTTDEAYHVELLFLVRPEIRSPKPARVAQTRQF